MKITNLTKLIIRFLGGGKIDFPTSNLREVEIEPFDGESGNEGSGNNDELISNTKMAFANFLNRDIGEGSSYTKDDVELPDKYIYVDSNNKEIYEIYPCGAGMAFPLYLKNRNLNENNIVLSIGGLTLYENARITNLDTIPSDFTNRTSLNLIDYHYFRANLI